jgi:hypothetical protein
MPISVKVIPQLLCNRHNHVPISQPRLQNLANLNHKIIRISFGAGEAKTTLAGKSYPPAIPSAFRTQVFTVPTLFFATPQHLLHHFVIILCVIRRMARFEFIPMIQKYPAESVSVDTLHKPLVSS